MTEDPASAGVPLTFGLRGEVLHLDQGYVRRIFYERAKCDGLPKRAPQPPGHTAFAGHSSFCAATCRSKIVQQFLGQQSPTLTASYLHFSP